MNKEKTEYIGIVGSRRRNTQEDKTLVLETVRVMTLDKDKEIILVSGGCKKGADHFAEEIAKELGLKIIIYKPDLKGCKVRWDYTKRCYDRNTLIADKSDVLIACVAPDRKGGTEDTIKKFLHKYEKNNERLFLV